MTREEKIQKAIDDLPREEKLKRIRESMKEWDYESLLDSAFSSVEESLTNISNADFDDEYYEWFSHEFEDSDFDDDEEQQSVVDAISEAPLKCVCGSGGNGCSDYCDLVTGKHSPDAY